MKQRTALDTATSYAFFTLILSPIALFPIGIFYLTNFLTK